jgi:hypothetical protein
LPNPQHPGTAGPTVAYDTQVAPQHLIQISLHYIHLQN